MSEIVSAHAASHPVPSDHHVSTIDTLRALAILSVLGHHVYAYTGFEVPYLDRNGGLIGVQLFFLISGYLIIQSAIKYPLKVFFIHRFFRIFPPYLCALLGFALGKYILIDSYRTFFNENYPYFLLNLLNLQYFHPVSVLFLDSIHVGWSLTVELIWYLLAPLVVLYIGRKPVSGQRLIHLMIASVVLSILWVYPASRGGFNFLYQDIFQRFGLSIANPTFRHSIIDNFPLAQMMFFLLGAALWVFRTRLHQLPSSVIMLTFVSILLFIPQWNAWLTIYPNFLTGLGLAALFLWVRRFGIHDQVLLWVAQVSYSIYLVHVPILLLVFKYWHIEGLPGLLLSLALILGLAQLSWIYVEKPSQDLGKRLAKKYEV